MINNRVNSIKLSIFKLLGFECIKTFYELILILIENNDLLDIIEICITYHIEVFMIKN